MAVIGKSFLNKKYFDAYKDEMTSRGKHFNYVFAGCCVSLKKAKIVFFLIVTASKLYGCNRKKLSEEETF